MPTNAEIHAAITKYVRAQRSHILTDDVAQILDDMVDNIAAGGGGTSGINSVLAEEQALTADRVVDLNGNALTILEGEEQLLWFIPLQTKLMATNGDARSHVQLNSDPLGEIKIQLRSDDGSVNEAEIVLNGGNATARYQAVNGHEFALGDVTITALAGGGTTGLSIDNDGKIIRTP